MSGHRCGNAKRYRGEISSLHAVLLLLGVAPGSCENDLCLTVAGIDFPADVKYRRGVLAR
ncbi:MAG: hypothetical protein HY525_15500 [Betaproteobacteria bacterium]|nr:hypothetical protein [Betaproteobacteria bacterium]